MISMDKRSPKEESIEKILEKRVIRNFIDLLILFEIYKTPLISGYDIFVTFQKKFNLMISPGTVYLTLYKLEREGLIKGEERRRKRVYILTNKGEKLVRKIPIIKENINFLLSRI